jgi:hypothetical protein
MVDATGVELAGLYIIINEIRWLIFIGTTSVPLSLASACKEWDEIKKIVLKSKQSNI